MKIAKIISGGQTGADQGGLDAAIHCSLPHGGWCPKGRKSENGAIPAKYLIQEHKSANYLARTKANVVDSDATVIFTSGELEGGSLKTAQFAQKHNKPYLHVNLAQLSRPESIQAVVAWLRDVCPDNCTLNVAGSRESKAPGIQRAVMDLMSEIIGRANSPPALI